MLQGTMETENPHPDSAPEKCKPNPHTRNITQAKVGVGENVEEVEP